MDKVINFLPWVMRGAETHRKTKDQIIKKYRSVLKDFGFSDYVLSSLRGYDPEGEKLDENILDVLISHETFDAMFEKKIMEDLKGCSCDEAIEVHALDYINSVAFDLIGGLIAAQMEIARRLGESSDPSVKIELREILSDFENRFLRSKILEAKTGARIAEITGEEYRNMSKEQWESHVKILEKGNKG